jgi:hypothetical protein
MKLYKTPIPLDSPADVDHFLIPTVGTGVQLALSSPLGLLRTDGW